jgi:PAS domain S-box-containing protein
MDFEAVSNGSPDSNGQFSLFEHAHDAILIFDPETKEVLEVNKSACEIYGYSKEEFIGLNLEDISKNKDDGKKAIKELLKNKSKVKFDSVQYRKDGSEMIIEIYAALVDYKGKKAVLSINRDITAFKLAEEALEKSEEQFRLIFEQAPIGIAMTSLDSKFIKVNKTLANLLGYTEEELLKLSPNDITHPDDRAKNIELNKKLTSGEINEFSIEKRYLHKNGSSINVLVNVSLLRDKNGNPLNATGHVIDLTESTKAEQKIRETQLRLSTLLNNLPNVVFYETGEGHEFITENIFGLIGYSAEEIFSSRDFFTSLIYPEDRGKLYEGLKQWHAVNEPGICTFEFRAKRKDGTYIWLEDHIFEIKPANGEKYMSGVMIDITERKIIEESIREKTEEVSLLYEAGRLFNSTLVAKNIYRYFHKLVSRIIEFEKMVIYIYNPIERSLTCDFTSGGELQEYEEPAPQIFGTPEFKSLFKAIDEGEPKLFTETANTTKGNNESRGENSVLIAPLRTGDTLAGLAKISRPSERSYSEDDLKIFNALVQQLSLARTNAYHYQQAQNEISERKRVEKIITDSLKEKELLIKEIHHRVKNNLQIISSLLKLQSGYIKDKEALEMLVESRNRIQSMAMVHQKLYQSKDLSKINFQEYINQLLAHLFQVYKVDNNLIALNVNARDIKVGVDTAIPCGLVINELVSNSLKHAFPGGRKGKIEIEMNETGPLNYILSVSDNGIGFPKDIDFRNTVSLGMQLIITLSEQLDGKINLMNGKGTKFVITFQEQDYSSRI